MKIINFRHSEVYFTETRAQTDSLELQPMAYFVDRNLNEWYEFYSTVDSVDEPSPARHRISTAYCWVEP